MRLSMTPACSGIVSVSIGPCKNRRSRSAIRNSPVCSTSCLHSEATMRILFTGASSFTGCWIVQELVHAGHEVTAVFTKTGPEDYRGLRRNRLDHVLPLVRTVWETRFGDERFLDLCRDG